MSTAHRSRSSFRQSPMQHLAFPNQFTHSFGHRFNRHIRVNPMLVIEVDVVRTQTTQRTFHRFTDCFGTAGQTDGTRRRIQIGCLGQVITKLGGDDNLVPDRLQRLPYHVLILAIAIYLGGIKESHPQIYCLAYRFYHILTVGIRRITLCKSHAAQSYGRHFQIFS